MSHNTDIDTLINYMQSNWNLKSKPKLLLSVLNSKIQSETSKEKYIAGLIKTSMDAGDLSIAF